MIVRTLVYSLYRKQTSKRGIAHSNQYMNV